MRIIGIDPGMAIVGWAILDIDDNNAPILVSAGSIQTDKKKSDAQRLEEIYNDLNTIIDKYNPDVASIEKLFYFKNQKTIIPVAEARGVILLVLEQRKIKFAEYTPMEIKQTITGFGRASKQEVAQMVKILLEGQEIPKLDDTVDSIAIAICHTRNLICA